MWFFHRIFAIFQENVLVFKILCVATGAFFLVAVLAFFCNARSIFDALSAVIGGVAFGAISLSNAPVYATTLGGAGLLAVFGLHRFALLIALLLRDRRKTRRARREEALRKLKFTLPDRDNSFVQARLYTALQPKSQPNDAEGEKQTFRLEHARALLEKIKNAPLSKTERMEAEELSKLFYAYLKKSKWTAEDVRMLNEIFAYLLKLSAKYSV